ncbi:MAG: DUF1028 domain-containing protein [Methanomassiliicoccales archaeon]|nr:DUF1028 domain-containing protein [Methanomassiliicoccales archaeon]TFG56163.1 MAG: DUF1028 domain-containing protein [Methanomassiliicoccus sp.]
MSPGIPSFGTGSTFAHTYSIVARDESTGEIGAGVQSHWFSVGTVVPWALAGVGAVVTQSFTNPAFGPQGLELLSQGVPPQEAVARMVRADGGRDFRQLAVIDRSGRTCAYTGSKCVAEAGHICGHNFSVQANMMLSDRVWPKMAEAFEGSEGPLAERIMTVLEAAESVGGDVRGRQSAAILVVKAEGTGSVWKDRVVDLRVDDHAEPLKEMRRLLRVHRAYESMDAGDAAMEKGNMASSLECYSKAESLFPGNEEMVFWHAVALANNGRFEESVPLFRKTFAKNPNWKLMLGRLVPSGMLKLGQEQIGTLLRD